MFDVVAPSTDACFYTRYGFLNWNLQMFIDLWCASNNLMVAVVKSSRL